MSERRQTGAEPSMDEILASIRRIIIEDDGTRDPVAPDGEAVEAETAAAPEPPSFLRGRTSVPEAPTARERGRTSDRLSALSHMLVRNYEGSEDTLEGLVREMLRPMLKEWLDTNLPGIVQEMVASEVSRITRK